MSVYRHCSCHHLPIVVVIGFHNQRSFHTVGKCLTAESHVQLPLEVACDGTYTDRHEVKILMAVTGRSRSDSK